MDWTEFEIKKTTCEIQWYAQDKKDIENGLIPYPHKAFKDNISLFSLQIENCRITDVKCLNRLIKNELERIKNSIQEAHKNQEEIHFMEYGVVDFYENILKSIKKTDENDYFNF